MHCKGLSETPLHFISRYKGVQWADTDSTHAQKKYCRHLNINHSSGFSMLVQCPSCDEELDVDLDQGLFFECPTWERFELIRTPAI